MAQQLVQFKTSGVEFLGVGGIYDEHYRIHAVAVTFPHRAEFRLTRNVPDFEGHIALSYFSEYEADGGDDVLAPLARTNDIYKGRLS